MKTSSRQLKARKNRVADSAKPALQRPKKIQSLKPAEIRQAQTTTLEETGQHNPTWQVQNDWPNLFRILKKETSEGLPLYQVKMAEILEATFSALEWGNSNVKVVQLYKALFLLHLCKVDEVEFGSSAEMFLGIETSQPLDLAKIDPYCIEQTQRAVKVVELLKSSLSAELAKIASPSKKDGAEVKRLRKYFLGAVKIFAKSYFRSRKKGSAKFYPYQNKEVCLPWLAIRLAHMFVTDHRKLPTKIQLREITQKAVREEANRAAQVAQARKEAAQTCKEIALAEKEAEQATKKAAEMNKPISPSTWSDALSAAGLSELPEGKKFSSSLYMPPSKLDRNRC